MTVKDQAIHRAAAVRLLTCGTSWDNDYIFEYLASHIGDLATEFNALHVNDRAAMSQVMRHEKKGETLLQTWKGIYKDVVARHGVKHVRTTHAALGLGDAYGENSNAEKMEELEREVVAVREELLGTDHEETLLARSNLARTLCNTKRYREAEEIQKAILRIRIRSLDKDTALSLEDLAATYHNQKRYSEEQALMMGAVDIRTVRAGRSHVGTIGSIEVLAECYQLQGHVQEAERLVMEAVALRQLVYGDQHLVTVGTMSVQLYTFAPDTGLI
jgi:tetratricopeptide (TPR) repeat protein